MTDALTQQLYVFEVTQTILIVVVIVVVGLVWRAVVNQNQLLRAVTQQRAAVLSHLETRMPPEERAAMLLAIDAHLSELTLKEILDAVAATRHTEQ
jgi:hypothetical protein